MLIEKRNGSYSVCRIPGMVCTQAGTLLAYYECRNELSDWAQIDLKVIRSTDGGETWQTVKLIEGNGHTLNNPVMVVKEETIHFLYCSDYHELYACRSTDDGLTFTQAEDITAVWAEGGRFYNAAAIGPGHGIVHNGVILIPNWFAYDHENPKSHHPSFLRVLYSADDGASWQLGDVIGEGVLRDPNESALAVTADGQVLISIRNENPEHQRALAVSQTGYDGWQDLHLEPALPDPVCMGSMTHRNGTVYHVNCASQTAREKLTVKILRNGAWEAVLVDELGGYADIALRKDELCVLYERNIAHDGIYFKKIWE